MSADNPYAGLPPDSVPSLYQRLQLFAHLSEVPAVAAPSTDSDPDSRPSYNPDGLTVNELRECFKIVQGYCAALGPNAKVNPEMVNGLVTFVFMGSDPKEKLEPLQKPNWKNVLQQGSMSSKAAVGGNPNVHVEARLTIHLQLETSVQICHTQEDQSIFTAIREAYQLTEDENIQAAYDIALESLISDVAYALQYYNSYRAKIYMRRALNAMYRGRKPPKTYDFVTMEALVQDSPQFRNFLPLRNPIDDIWEARCTMDWVGFWEWDPENPEQIRSRQSHYWKG